MEEDGQAPAYMVLIPRVLQIFLCQEIIGHGYTKEVPDQQRHQDKMLDKGLGMIRNGIPVQTLKVNFAVDIMLGEASGVVSMKRGVATEESIDNNSCAERG